MELQPGGFAYAPAGMHHYAWRRVKQSCKSTASDRLESPTSIRRMIRAKEWPRNNNRKVPDWWLHARLANVKSGLMQALTISSAGALEKQFAEIAESQPELLARHSRRLV